MKVLFVSLDHSEQGSGGKVITQRNRKFVESYFGEDNVCFINTYLKNEIKNHSIEKTAERLNVDAVFLDASFFGPFSKDFYKKYLVFTFFHNVESNYANQIKSKGLKQKLINYLTKLTEKRNCLSSFKIITLNERDSIELHRIYGRFSDFVLPSSMKDEFEETAYQDGDYLLFVGTDFFGNTDGLFPFIESCMESIDCNLKVVGNGMDRYAGKYGKEYKTEFIGFVDDLALVYANAKAVVLPIVSGSGMKTKTCEALMYGKHIFGTEEAFEGYDITDSDCCLCDSNDEFINKINNFLKKENSYYSEKNRKLFLERYDNKAVYEFFKSFMCDSIKHMLPDRFYNLNKREIKVIQGGDFADAPDVSVIMPVYNTGKYLSDSLGSIIKQTLSNIQIIVIDDGSTDDSLKILRDYAALDNRITLISQRNSAQGAARNLGLKYAVGRYIYFMDSDDSLELSALEELVKVADSDDLDTIMFGGKELWDYKCKYPGVFNGQDLFVKLLKTNEILSAPCIFFTRRNVAINSIRFPENCYTEDMLIAYQLMMSSKKVRVIHRDYYHVTLRSDSCSRIKKGACNAVGYLSSVLYLNNELKKAISTRYLNMEVKNNVVYLRDYYLLNFILFASELYDFERQFLSNYLDQDSLCIWEKDIVPYLDYARLGKIVSSLKIFGWKFTLKLIMRKIRYELNRM